GADEPYLPLQANWIGSWTTVAMAVQCSRRSRATGVSVETRHMQAVLKAQINKTDRNDARGIAQMMRVGLYRPLHVKTCECCWPPASFCSRKRTLTHQSQMSQKCQQRAHYDEGADCLGL